MPHVISAGTQYLYVLAVLHLVLSRRRKVRRGNMIVCTESIISIPLCKHDWILVIPSDMHFLPDNLAAKMKQYTNHAKLVAINNKDRLQLLFLLHRSLIDSITLYSSSNQHTVMHWLDSVEHYVLAIDNENHF